MPTIDDIAQACGTSKATVSKVLNGNDHKISAAKREEIQLTIRRMQYRPSAHARSLSKRRGNMIGVVTCRTTALFDSQYYAALLNAILDEVTARKQTLALFNGQIWVDENKSQLVFADGRCDGLIIINAPSMPELIPALLRTPLPFIALNSDAKESTLPFVVVNSGPMPERVHSIDIDDVNVGYTATRYLIEQGHRKIAFFHSYDQASFSQERLLGYQRAMTEASLPSDPALVFLGDSSFQSGYERARDLAANNTHGVTALCCASDIVALAAMQSLKDAGHRIPEEYSVIGVDDTPDSARSLPALTTVSQFLNLMGAHATRMLLDLIEDPSLGTQKVIWPTKLIVRESVAALHA
jgi:DNA-binding LacI/PurR family transcriptional regulator